jgi:hypothetical protein
MMASVFQILVSIINALVAIMILKINCVMGKHVQVIQCVLQILASMIYAHLVFKLELQCCVTEFPALKMKIV